MRDRCVYGPCAEIPFPTLQVGALLVENDRVMSQVTPPTYLSSGRSPFHERIAVFQGWMFLGGSAVIGLALLLRGSDWAGVSVLFSIASACLTCGLLLLLLRPSGIWLAAVANWLGIVAISVAIGSVRPLLLIPCFYVWPLLVSAAHFSRRHAGWDVVFASVAFAVALFGFADTTERAPTFVMGMGLMGVVVLVTSVGRARTAVLHRELRVIARTDALTGILNRRGFFDGAATMLRGSTDTSSVMVLDIDHFKMINDEFGHPAGDEVLQRVASLLASRVRRDHLLARVGGEEFAVLAPGCGESGARALAERLRGALESERFPAVERVTASFGVATLLDADGLAGALREADRALYCAKRRGRNQVVAADALQEEGRCSPLHDATPSALAGNAPHGVNS